MYTFIFLILILDGEKVIIRLWINKKSANLLMQLFRKRIYNVLIVE